MSRCPRTHSGRRPCPSRGRCNRRLSTDGHGRAPMAACSGLTCAAGAERAPLRSACPARLLSGGCGRAGVLMARTAVRDSGPGAPGVRDGRGCGYGRLRPCPGRRDAGFAGCGAPRVRDMADGLGWRRSRPRDGRAVTRSGGGTCVRTPPQPSPPCPCGGQLAGTASNQSPGSQQPSGPTDRRLFCVVRAAPRSTRMAADQPVMRAR
jgi:hypothetical protein